MGQIPPSPYWKSPTREFLRISSLFYGSKKKLKPIELQLFNFQKRYKMTSRPQYESQVHVLRLANLLACIETINLSSSCRNLLEKSLRVILFEVQHFSRYFIKFQYWFSKMHLSRPTLEKNKVFWFLVKIAIFAFTYSKKYARAHIISKYFTFDMLGQKKIELACRKETLYLNYLKSHKKQYK